MGKKFQRRVSENAIVKISGDVEESVNAIIEKLEERRIIGGESGYPDPTVKFSDELREGHVTQAKVLVSGGRGIGSREFFLELQKVADLLGGVVSSSRANVAAGWIDRSRQIGQTGKYVKPEIYLACGIAGMDQHIAGIIDSKYIIAINSNSWAPIFRYADLGIVGDVRELIPRLIDRLKKYNSK